MLYGIKQIQYCQNNALAFNGVQNQFLGICPELTNALTDVVGFAQRTATLTIEERIENRTRLFTAKLQFTTPHIVDFSAYSYAFVVTTTEGIRFLIGAQSRPRVVVTTVQSQTGAADGSTGYTTTATFTANYRPNQLPAPEEPAPDTRQFTVCCGKIDNETPISGPEYDVCCGEIVGEVPAIQKNVVWIDYDRTPLDSKTYYSNQPEPTTSVVPTRQPTSEYTYTFAGWVLISQTETMKVYQATYTEEPVVVTLTVIWQDDDGTEIERKTYTEGSSEPQPSSTPANRRYNELFGYKFNGWSLYSEADNTKIYRATYVNAIYDWSAVEPTGEQSADLEHTLGYLGTTFEPVNSPASEKCWVFWSTDGTTLHKSPFYRTAWQSIIFDWGHIPCLVFIFIYNNNVHITESGLDPGTIESGVRGQWYALGTQGNYKVYGWRTADWTGFAPAYGQFIPMT